MQKLPPTRLLLTGIFVAFGGSFQYGFQLSYINPTEDVISRFFNQTYFSHYGYFLTAVSFRILWSVTTGIMLLGAFIGAMFLTIHAHTFGRKYGLCLAGVLLGIAGIISSCSFYINAFELFMFGRFLYGFSLGLSVGLQALYLSEISPDKHRGFVGSKTGLFVEIGLATGAIVGTPALLGDEDRWHWIFWLETIPTVLLLIFLIFSVESPAFLLSKHKELEARSSVALYHGKNVDIDAVLNKIRHEIHTAGQSFTILNVFGEKSAWKGMALAMVANAAVSFSGVITMGFFATHLLVQIGFSHQMAAYANIVITFGTFVGALLSMWTIEHYGRRPLLLFSCTAMLIINIVMMISVLSYQYYPTVVIGYLFMVISIVFMVCFGVGLAVIPWFLATELVPEKCKPPVQSLAVMTQYFTGFLVPLIFYPLEGQVGGFSFLLFAIPLAFITLYFYFYLPETKPEQAKETVEESAISIAQIVENTNV